MECYLNAGEELAALRKRQRETPVSAMVFEDDGLEDLFVIPEKKKKTGKDKKNKKKKSEEEEKPKAPVPVEPNNEEESDDEELSREVMERVRSTQKNLNHHHRMQAMQAPCPEIEELEAMLAAGNRALELLENAPVTLPKDLPVMVLVRWQVGQGFDQYSLTKYETFEKIFQFYAEKMKVSVERILMEVLNDEAVTTGIVFLKPWFTTKCLKFETRLVYLDCTVTQEEAAASTSYDYEDGRDAPDDGKMEVKFQLKGRRDKISVRVGGGETFTAAFNRVATTVKQPLQNLRFIFDGETVLESQTPDDLEFEGGEMLDCKIIVE